MKVLVIGGTRFVGLRLVRALAQGGHDITLLNRGKTQADLPPGLKRLYADRRDADAIRNALKDQSFEVVFDMTGYQVRSVEPVVEALAGRVEHYIFQSTAGVYTDGETLPITEDSPTLSPETAATGFAAYEVEKVQCEQYLLRQVKERLFPATIFRCPIIYGPENWMHDREFSFFVRLTQGRPVLVPGNGNTFLSFAHADDVARAHMSVAGVIRTVGQVYNITGQDAITINGYVDHIASLAGAEPRKLYVDWSAMKGLEKGFFPFRADKSQLFSGQKAADHFRFTPQFDIKSGLGDTYRWWVGSLGVERTVFTPGKLGNDVDLDYEAELARRYG